MLRTKNFPNNWQYVQLSEILDSIESGKRPKGGTNNITKGISSIGGEHLNEEGSFNFSKCKFIPQSFFENQKRGIIKKHDILIVKDGATTGKVSFVDENYPFTKSMVNEHIFILRPTPNVNPKWLFYYIFSSYGQSQIKHNTHGMIGGINTNFIKNFHVLLPPRNIQEKTVLILDIVVNLNKKRKKIIQLSKKLIPIIFVNMFKEIIKSKKSSIVSLEEIATVSDVDHKMPEKVAKGIPLISTKDFTDDGEIDFTNTKQISKVDFMRMSKRVNLKRDDILFSRYGTLGKCVKINTEKKFTISYSLVLISPNKNLVNSIYLFYFFKSQFLEKQIKEETRTTGIPDIGIKSIRQFKIPLPDLVLQEQFSADAKKVEFLIKKLRYSQKKDEVLFASLQSKIFKGELIK